METKYEFVLVQHRCEIRMMNAGKASASWYEVWIDGKLDGTRNPWPLDAENNPLSEQQLIADKVALETNLHQRREEVRLGKFQSTSSGT
jgi:hypothetical protein